MIALLAAAFLAALLWHAFAEAGVDALDIANNEDIDHGEELRERLVIAALIWVVASVCFFMLREGEPWWSPFVAAPAGWAWWTAGFRLRLNALRGKDWRYVSPSNWYDRQFIRVAYRDWPSAFKWALDRHAHIYNSQNVAEEFIPGEAAMLVSSYRECVHRAGTIALIFEALVFLGCAVTLYLVTI